MKIASWNLNHRTIEKPIPAEALRFFAAFGADLLVLNEFVDGHSRQQFRSELEKNGYKHQLVSSKIGKQNQIFVASKIAISRGDLNPPQQDDAAITNFLHITIDGTSLEIVGFRAPAYESSTERHSYWQELAAIMRSVGSRPIIFIGDVNYDPFSGITASVPEIRFDLAGSYSIPNPKGEWSFISLDGKNRTRIDHAIVADGVKVAHAEYFSSYDGISLADSHGKGAITDHAVLSLTLHDLD